MGLPYAVRVAYAELDPKTQKAFMRDYNRRKKSVLFAYFALIMLGMHYLYLRRVGLQFAFWFTFGGFFLWWLADWFRIPGIVSRMNQDTAREIMTQYRVMRAQPSAVIVQAPKP